MALPISVPLNCPGSDSGRRNGAALRMAERSLVNGAHCSTSLPKIARPKASPFRREVNSFMAAIEAS